MAVLIEISQSLRRLCLGENTYCLRPEVMAVVLNAGYSLDRKTREFNNDMMLTCFDLNGLSQNLLGVATGNDQLPTSS